LAKNKIFRDPIHNYISIPDDLCSYFIDTLIFQRLRNIEQTSMRTLFPSARHDRFSHSLGVFHLAQICYQNLIKNTKDLLLEGIDIEKYKINFWIAALMHDCGHSPFSHIFEEFYNIDKRADKFLLNQVDNKFKKDFEVKCQEIGRPADHEIFSAAIFLKHYSRVSRKIGVSPILVARMITGCFHEPARKKTEQFENCLIKLINSNAIDIDKLDFITRDTYHSGVNNISIDCYRLLSAVEIVEHDKKLVPAFKKSALSVIQNVIDARNYLYKWIYSHHTVVYFNEILKDALTKLSQKLSPPNDPNKIIKFLFSKDGFERAISIDNKIKIYLPSDIDILYLLKLHKEDISEAEEIFSRKPKFVPLWKTKAEFDNIFKDKDLKQKSKIKAHIKDEVKGIIRNKNEREKIKIVSVKPKFAEIRGNEIYISFGEKNIEPFKGREQLDEDKEPYYYVFIPIKYKDKISKIVQKLKEIRTYS